MKYGLLCITLICAFVTKSQDIHYAQFFNNPLYLNPANTGNFDANLRFVGNQRTQWRSVTRPYNTFSLSAEAINLFGPENIGYGVSFMHDVAGDSRLSTTEFLLSGSYKYILPDSAHVLRPAIQFGINHRQINYDDLNFDSQYNGFYLDEGLPNQEAFQTASKTAPALNLGLVYEWDINKEWNLNLGTALFNITRPKQSFFNVDSIRRDRRFVFHGQAEYLIDKEWAVLPAFFTSFQGKYREITLGAQGRFVLKNKLGEYVATYAGLWYRNQDAGFINLGLDYNDWRFGVSYDVNISGLRVASNLRGGFEFSVRYLMRFFKPDPVTYRICPDYV